MIDFIINNYPDYDLIMTMKKLSANVTAKMKYGLNVDSTINIIIND